MFHLVVDLREAQQCSDLEAVVFAGAQTKAVVKLCLHWFSDWHRNSVPGLMMERSVQDCPTLILPSRDKYLESGLSDPLGKWGTLSMPFSKASLFCRAKRFARRVAALHFLLVVR